ncbi:hypothetical protein [Clostridium sp.]|uniref:hypothetical protein n=1 Tax=Clostridium sp. TaxID=1506 RepID=UPI00284A04B0|nr:hypothetical protein [Clostridium sp.]MDR3595654.1 hypothetical protein [Clostridium sp.]
MKITKFSAFFLISLFAFVKIPQAQPIPIATTYTQGIYDTSQYTGKYITAKLITPGKPLTSIVINSKGGLELFLRFNDPNETVKLGPIQEGDVIVLVGTGEISFSPFS